MTELVVADIGGTHARFAVAEIQAGRVAGVSEPVVLKTADHPGLASAWTAFGRALGRPLPRAASIAIAGPTRGEVLQLTNTAWTLRPANLERELGLDRLLLVNDFGAVAHAIDQVEVGDIQYLCGPEAGLTLDGVTTVLGLGTGLGVAQLLRHDGQVAVIETEAAHIGFAPTDAVEDAILGSMRRTFGRVCVERILSGPGLANLYRALAEIEDRSAPIDDDAELWRAAISGEDAEAAATLERFSLILGSVVGDLALAHGARSVVLAGALFQRLRERLLTSGFHARFLAKGRMASQVTAIPILMLTHPQPGLLGAAAAFARTAADRA